MPWTFYNSNGQRLSSAATNISVLDIDGATDIGAAIVDADLFIIDDGAGGTNRKTAASRLKTYIGAAPAQADQTAIEAETNQDTYAPPDLIKHSPGVAKAWVQIDNGGARSSPYYNIDSITDTAAGVRTIVWDTDFSTTVYACVGSRNEGVDGHERYDTFATGSVRHIMNNNDWSAGVDIAGGTAAFGDQ
jgi:hypothetical protein